MTSKGISLIVLIVFVTLKSIHLISFLIEKDKVFVADVSSQVDFNLNGLNHSYNLNVFIISQFSKLIQTQDILKSTS
ncbi:MAG: hypothetical protein U9Q66_02950 [Patescibacteria group bacterium]|nr:hypothetical protein [Patescibacteria group bacterium]